MKTPLQVIFKNMAPSTYANLLIEDELEKIAEFGSRIIHCRVTIEHVDIKQMKTYRVHTFLNLPGREIASDVDTAEYADHNRLSSAIHDAFFQIRHRLMKDKDARVKKYHRAAGLKKVVTEIEEIA